ncbi:hypothetical protein [Rheinheimera sp. A13L]|uniref:hypothetical protein n=1 Tax=Rheinheimera sp. A13L TaxID=506534 RepID=UPI00058C57CD|nr:hypothetical protein [Rheinheimera sp. A13L]
MLRLLDAITKGKKTPGSGTEGVQQEEFLVVIMFDLVKLKKFIFSRFFVFLVLYIPVCYLGLFVGEVYSLTPKTCKTSDWVQERLNEIQSDNKDTNVVFYADCNELIKISTTRLVGGVCIADYYRLLDSSDNHQGLLFDGSLVAGDDCNFERSVFFSNSEHLTSEDDYVLIWSFLSDLTSDFKKTISGGMAFQDKYFSLDYYEFLFNEKSMVCFSNLLQEFSIHNSDGFFNLRIGGDYAPWYLEVKIEEGEVIVVGLTRGDIYANDMESQKKRDNLCKGAGIRKPGGKVLRDKHGIAY